MSWGVSSHSQLRSRYNPKLLHTSYQYLMVSRTQSVRKLVGWRCKVSFHLSLTASGLLQSSQFQRKMVD